MFSFTIIIKYNKNVPIDIIYFYLVHPTSVTSLDQFLEGQLIQYVPNDISMLKSIIYNAFSTLNILLLWDKKCN